MDDKDIVVVCHCAKHTTLYHAKSGKPLGSDVQYVDPYVCPDSKWDAIQSNSKLFVFAAFCPVYYTLEWDEDADDDDWDPSLNTLLDILGESLRVLKPGGKVIFPRAKNNDAVPKLQQLVGGGWKVSFIKEEDATFPILAPPHEETLIGDTIWVWHEGRRVTKQKAIELGVWPPKFYYGSFIVFTKRVDGGKRKRGTRKTRKSR